MKAQRHLQKGCVSSPEEVQAALLPILQMAEGKSSKGSDSGNTFQVLRSKARGCVLEAPVPATSLALCRALPSSVQSPAIWPILKQHCLRHRVLKMKGAQEQKGLRAGPSADSAGTPPFLA